MPSPSQLPDVWDDTAPGYASSAPIWSGFAAELLRRVPPGPDDAVLDIACGAGTLSLLAAPLAGRVMAVDFSPGMIEQTRIGAERAGVSNVETGVMDAMALDLDDASFDLAYCLFAYMFFPDRARAFAEMRRVVRPGGRVAIATWSTLDRRPMMRVGIEALAEAVPQLPNMFQKGDLQSTDECVAEMEAAGFTDVTSTTHELSVHFDNAAHYMDVTVDSAAPLVAMRKRMGDDAWRGLRDTLHAALERRIPDTGADLGATAILTTARR